MDVNHYWHSVAVRALLDSFGAFETNPKLLLLGLLGAFVMAVLVLSLRKWDAFLEHLIANIFIAFCGAVITWLLVFVWVFVHLPAKILSESNANLARVIAEKQQFSENINTSKDITMPDLQRQIRKLTDKNVSLHTSTVQFGIRPEIALQDKIGRIVIVIGMTNQSISPIRARLSCNRDIEMIGDLSIAGQGSQLYIKRTETKIDGQSYDLSSIVPPWTPENPMALALFTQATDLACDIKLPQ